MGYNVKFLKFKDGIVDTRIYNRPIITGQVKVGKRKYIRKYRDEENKRRSVSRSKQSIYELARNGQWEWFITLTFDGSKIDRYDYRAVTKKLSDWLSNLRKKSPELEYLFVPEQHKDGAYHFHGLVAKMVNVKIVDSGKKCKGEIIYNLGSYRFGFSTMTRVRDNVAVTRYIAKYVTKELLDSTKGRRRYWASRNLERPAVDLVQMDPESICCLWQELEEDNVYYNYSQSEYYKVQYYQNRTCEQAFYSI